MSAGLVSVLAVAAGVPLALGLLPGLRLPGPLLEILAGVVLGPSVLAWVAPDATVRALALLGLSFLPFLAGSEVDLRRFRGTLGRSVALPLGISAVAALAVVLVLLALGVGGAVLLGVALLATSLGLVVPVLADAGALARPVGQLTVAGASAGEVAAVVLLSVGLAGSDVPLPGRLLLLVLLLCALGVVALAVVGVEHSVRLTGLVVRLADTSAQIRVRLTVLLVAGLALAAQSLGFEAILGAFLAGLLVRALDPEPERSHPLYPVKIQAVGYGLLVPVFFVTSGLTLDLDGLVEHPAALAAVPGFLVALAVVRGLPAWAFRRELTRRELVAVALLQSTSLPFLLAASEIGIRMRLLDPATAAGLVAAGLVSVLVFPAVALTLLPRPSHQPVLLDRPTTR
ncbi:MAG TPA: cation:proton antiporter [Dermatophilaceae bacterium]|nr:cation:proton antiporter [Dermatophilaceae bacterium]